MKTKFKTYKLLPLIAAILLFPWLSAPAVQAVELEGAFIADEHPEVVEALGDHEFAEGVLEALTDAGTNWTELWGALESLDGITWSHGCWLVVNMPHLDRLEMTRSTLLEHVRFAYATRDDLPYTVPQELFREYILTYRIGDEPVRPWRSNIWWNYVDLVGNSTSETAQAINQWVADNLTVRERGFFGSRPDPLTIIAAGSGTESDIAGVAIAMCKTFGVPARSARVSVLGGEEGGYTWLEVYSDGEWIPMYPDHPEAFGDMSFLEREFSNNVTVVSATAAFTNQQVTSKYTDTGIVRIYFNRNGEAVDDFEHFTISAWNDGAWLPLDDLGFDLEEDRMTAEGDEGFPAVLGDGFYVVQYGVRNPRGDAYIRTVPLMVDAGDEIELDLILDIPASDFDPVDLVRRNIDPLPEIDFGYAAVEPDTFNFPSALSEGYNCILIFDPTAEPSIRMVPLVIEWARGSGASVLGIGVGNEIASHVFWMEHVRMNDTRIRFFADPDGTIAEAFGQTPNDEGILTRLPCVVLFNPGQEIVYLQDEYNLSVAEGLQRAVELSGTE